MRRRKHLKLTAAATTAAGVSSLLLPGCKKIVTAGTTAVAGWPETTAIGEAVEIDVNFHLLSRAAYGPRPGDLAALRASTPDQWIDQQLQPDQISDLLCDFRAAGFESLYHSPEIAFEYRKPSLRSEIVRHTLLRAVYSRRQLFEVMVGFWNDHFNIDLEKGNCVYLKPWDDTHVVRKHALGNFRDLLRASVTSPAMLVYLDGNQNRVTGPDDRPNENYARELLELHTMGAGRGYTQKDIAEAARALSGWRYQTKGFRRHQVYFENKHHDDGEKKVLGQILPAGGGADDVDRLVDIVCEHPATGRYLAEKLCTRFVNYDPPQRLVAEVAKIFVDQKSEIRPMVRAILTSPEFAAARGTKLKRPLRFVASAFRGLLADTHAHPSLVDRLQRMGQSPFQYPSPDGYPDEELPWLGTLLWRWNFGFELAAGKLPEVKIDLPSLAKSLGLRSPKSSDAGEGSPRIERLFAHLCGRVPSSVEAQALEPLAAGIEGDPLKARDLLGVVLSSPAFQRT